jgi:hypothetical protein
MERRWAHGLLVDGWRVLAARGFAAPASAGASGVPSNTTANSWTVADINGDGRDDLVSASTSGAQAVCARERVERDRLQPDIVCTRNERLSSSCRLDRSSPDRFRR